MTDPWPDVDYAPTGGTVGEVPRWNERPLDFRLAKRTLDLAIALPLFLLTVPLQVAIALLIRLDSPGPALFRQPRLALHGKSFPFLKFRTMCIDSRKRFPHLYDYRRIVECGGRAALKQVVDPRLTRVGRWLRRTSLDELPNLLNVIRGEMSLVGPRPEIPELLAVYSPEQLQVFRVKPGMTGLPQVSGRNQLTVAETVALDHQYAREVSIRLDLFILYRTIGAVVTGRGAR